VEAGVQEVLVEVVVQVGLELRQDLQFLQGLLTQSQLVRVVRVLLALLIHKKDSILFFPQLLLLVAGRVELAWAEETEALAAVGRRLWHRNYQIHNLTMDAKIYRLLALTQPCTYFALVLSGKSLTQS
jgi:hypothetical protein